MQRQEQRETHVRRLRKANPSSPRASAYVHPLEDWRLRDRRRHESMRPPYTFSQLTFVVRAYRTALGHFFLLGSYTGLNIMCKANFWCAIMFNTIKCGEVDIRLRHSTHSAMVGRELISFVVQDRHLSPTRVLASNVFVLKQTTTPSAIIVTTYGPNKAMQYMEQ